MANSANQVTPVNEEELIFYNVFDLFVSDSYLWKVKILSTKRSRLIPEFSQASFMPVA